VLGAGDPGRSSTVLVRRFLRRQIPAYVDGTLNIVGVEDVARGHLLADERGGLGERYILGNRNYTMERLLADLGRLSGVEPPVVKLPVSLALGLSGLGRRAGLSLPAPAEIKAASLNWAFSSRRAKRELGWRTSPHEDSLEATVGWYRELDGNQLVPAGTRQPYPLRVSAVALRRLGIGR
jgi:dihydroflavonol-4-reductase